MSDYLSQSSQPLLYDFFYDIDGANQPANIAGKSCESDILGIGSGLEKDNKRSESYSDDKNALPKSLDDISFESGTTLLLYTEPQEVTGETPIILEEAATEPENAHVTSPSYFDCQTRTPASHRQDRLPISPVAYREGFRLPSGESDWRLYGPPSDPFVPSFTGESCSSFPHHVPQGTTYTASTMEYETDPTSVTSFEIRCNADHGNDDLPSFQQHQSQRQSQLHDLIAMAISTAPGNLMSPCTTSVPISLDHGHYNGADNRFRPNIELRGVMQPELGPFIPLLHTPNLLRETVALQAAWLVVAELCDRGVAKVDFDPGRNGDSTTSSDDTSTSQERQRRLSHARVVDLVQTKGNQCLVCNLILADNSTARRHEGHKHFGMRVVCRKVECTQTYEDGEARVERLKGHVESCQNIVIPKRTGVPKEHYTWVIFPERIDLDSPSSSWPTAAYLRRHFEQIGIQFKTLENIRNGNWTD
ncbi:hypothetical protein BJ508DRAFT_364252 [Ascobolus immersus RN42]|uniref:Uncharacterized protein n=1 Tax=Ascobolus immersus RN42 TaxID=1160509 RepID=A0A3N4I0V7_ASCIM|nr:hypothetical protein BJ508DRAFT_364252 [Ascobolus immersus RN42]